MSYNEYFKIGKDRKARYITDPDSRDIIGLEELHLNQSGILCGSTIWFGDEQSEWQLLCREPLVVWPSIVCNNCNSHGFLVESEWQDDLSVEWLTTIIKDYIDGIHPNQREN